MQVIHNLDLIPRNISTVLSVGKFDGVHLGHQQLIREVVARARTLRVSSAVVTFDPHPFQVLCNGRSIRVLTPLPLKLRLFEGMGLDAVVVLPFTREFAAISPESFVREILVDSLHVKEIHEGNGFRFGRSGVADCTQLVEMGIQYGFGVRIHPPVKCGDCAVSSTTIRRLLATGNMELAALMLAQPLCSSALEFQLA